MSVNYLSLWWTYIFKLNTMIIRFKKGKRNRYKFPIGFYIKRIEIHPFGNNHYKPKMRTINFRYKDNVYCIFINWNNEKK